MWEKVVLWLMLFLNYVINFLSMKVMITKTTKKKSKEEAYEKIQHLILSTQIKPGESITENSLAAQLGIGRTPIREALTQLEQEGLIVSHNGRKKVYVLTIQEVKEIFDIKIALEGSIAGWAAAQGNDRDRQKLKEIMGYMVQLAKERPGDEQGREKYLSSWISYDRQLHEVIFSMSNNKKAEEFIEKLNTQWHRLRATVYALEGRIAESAVEHENFVQHIINQEPEAAERAMREHLKNLKKELIKAMQLFHYPEV